MRFNENPALGRKVFFINPPFAIEKKIIPWLHDAEYEVYTIKEYEYAKAVLKNCENAICFINIDEQLSLKGWFNFIKSFELDSTLQTIFLGLVATKTTPAQVNKFIMNLNLPGGYIPLANVPAEDTFKQIAGILELNKAKGERKVVHLNCEDNDTLNGYIAYGNKLYSMRVENISSLGLTCALDAELSRSLKKNTLLDNVSLSLGRWSVITQCVVVSLKSFEGKTIAILFFIKETPKEVKVSIRRFIFDSLSKHLNEYMLNSVKDTEDYTVAKGFDEIPDYNAPTDSDVVVEEAEEVKDDDNKDSQKEDKKDSSKEDKPAAEEAKTEEPETEDAKPEEEKSEEAKSDDKVDEKE